MFPESISRRMLRARARAASGTDGDSKSSGQAQAAKIWGWGHGPRAGDTRGHPREKLWRLEGTPGDIPGGS